MTAFRGMKSSQPAPLLNFVVRMLCLYQAELNLGAPNHEGNGIHARRVARARRSTTSVHQRMEGPRRGLQLAVLASRQGSSHPEYVGSHSVLLICSME